MDHGHTVAEIGGEFPHHLGGERDLRHQDHGGPPLFQRALHQTEVDQGLSAAGDAVEQGDGSGPLLHRRGDLLVSCLLLLVQHDLRRFFRRGADGVDAELLLLIYLDQPALFQRRHR